MTEKEPWRKKVDLFRQKFRGREDVFFGSTVVHKMETNPVTGEQDVVEFRSFSPVCMNYGNKNLCLITQRRGGCSECSNRELQPVTDAWVYKHINGESDMIIPMLTEKGIRFGAADFDIGEPFEDAKAVRDLSVACGLPCYIARSSKKGYHVYWFFSDWVPAHHFTSYLRYLFTEAGFYQRRDMNPQMRLPEVFPKQIAVADQTKFGNGIKVPMIEPKMKDGFNCWVDDSKVPLPFDKQWEFLASTTDISPQEFEKVLEDRNIEVLRAAASRDFKEARQIEGRGGEGGPSKIVPFGSFEEVILGCPAMGRLWAKNSEGKYLWDISNPKGLFHDARFASMALAIHTKDGEDMIRSRWSSPKTDSYLRQAKAAGYTPVTCQWMQEKGICIAGRDPKKHDHCMEKLPPRVRDGGKEIINPDNLPPEQWPAPSPIRIATSKHLDVDGVIEMLHQLAEAKKQKLREGPPEIDPETGHPIIKEVYIPDNVDERIAGVLRRARGFSPDDRRKIEETISAYKLLPKKELKAIEKQVAKEIKEDEIKQKTSGKRSFQDGTGTYFMDPENCNYEFSYIDAKGVPQMKTLTNFIVVLTEEFVQIKLVENAKDGHEHEVMDRYYNGYIKKKTVISDGEKEESQISTHVFSGLKVDTWLKGREAFFRHLAKISGLGISYQTSDMDAIRNCIYMFNHGTTPIKQVCQDVGHYRINNNDIYVSPSVIVTKDEIKPNTLYHIDIENEAAFKDFDLKLLSRDEAKELCYHLVNDFFYCNTPDITRTCFAHAMASTLLPQLQRAVHFARSPVLTIAGNVSGGKTFIAQKTASFFGANQSGYVITSTTYAIGLLASMYRHSLLVLNDYKKAVAERRGIDIVDVIQKAYDRDERLAGTRSGGLRQRSSRARGLIMITGEDIPNSESSVVSRQIAIEGSPKPNLEKGEAVNKMSHLYSGFTAYFIQFAFQMTDGEIENLWKSYYYRFMDGMKDKPMFNASNRVCENLTVNMVAFHIAMNAMVGLGLDETLRDKHITEHFNTMCNIREWVMEEVAETRGSSTFIRLLSGMMQDTGRYKVDGWVFSDNVEAPPSAKSIGFYQLTEPDVLFLTPDTALAAASEVAGRSGITLQSTSYTGKQLREDGVLEERLLKDNKRNTTTRRGPAGTVARVWPIKLSSLGIEPASVPRAKNVVKIDTTDKRTVR